MTKEEKFKYYLDTMYDTFCKKNKAYGSSSTDTFNKYGPVSYLVRLTDKLNRASTLICNPDIDSNDESIQDTLLDMANYAILAVIDINSNTKGDRTTD